MKKLLTIIYKEVLILIRDIPGLIILFLMPMFLILIVTLFQENIFSTANNYTPILLCDFDNSSLSEMIKTGLEDSDYFIIKEIYKNDSQKEEKIKALISQGEYQVGIIIPEGAFESATNKADEIIEEAISKGSDFSEDDISKENLTEVLVYLDPAIQQSFKISVINSLKSLIHGVEIKIMMDSFMRQQPEEIENQINKKISGLLPVEIEVETPVINLSWDSESLILVKDYFAGYTTTYIKPTTTQNNVPAYTLFAMFFIVVPLSTSLITEKRESTYNRLKTLPVFIITLLSGKIITYLFICLIQFGLMIGVGTYLLPLFGAPALIMGTNYIPIIITTVSSAFAAIGFGMLIGTIFNTYAQASMFGSLIVVIFGSMGGIMIPVYLMPENLRLFSEIISPIRWGIDSFLDIFLRGGTIDTIMSNALRLISFFIISTIISILKFVRRY